MSVKLVKFKQELKNQLKLKMAYKDRAFYKGSWLWRKELIIIARTINDCSIYQLCLEGNKYNMKMADISPIIN